MPLNRPTWILAAWIPAAVVGFVAGAPAPGHAFSVSFSSGDFTTTPVVSMVETFAFDLEVTAPLGPGLFADPTLSDIQYSVSGDLGATPSGFPSFAFQLADIFPTSPPIPGSSFYALNGSAVPGQTLRFEIAVGADLSDGLQIDELADLGGGVVFRLDGREEGTGRYHPALIELRSDGTGRIQNSNNQGGTNPLTNMVVDVDFGDEYVTDLAFDPAALTIAVPEPGVGVLLLLGLGVGRLRRLR